MPPVGDGLKAPLFALERLVKAKVRAFTCSLSTIDAKRANGKTKLLLNTVIQLEVASSRRCDLLESQLVSGANNGTSTKTALCVSHIAMNFFLTSVL